MKSWAQVNIPAIENGTTVPLLHLTNSKTGKLQEVPSKPEYRMYVCGITPYDATHLGHAATYLTFDLINRYLIACGSKVHYVQNITDIDDPLLERAKRDGVEWAELANSQIDLFTSDMVNLRVIPPEHYIGAVEAIPLIISAIETLQDLGSIYPIGTDFYFSNSAQSDFGGLSHLGRAEMELIFSQRGGNPTLEGKRDSLDCLVWMSQRKGEPGWTSSLGTGRPGWHIECTAIALEYLHPNSLELELIDIQGGGNDLIFPHHEMCRSQAKILTGKELATNYVHAGMIGLDGEKMSKSKGNLVLVSELVRQDVDPVVIRFALISDHYRSDRMWSNQLLLKATLSIERLRNALDGTSLAPTREVINEIFAAIADDLDTPRVISALDSWVQRSFNGETGGDRSALELVLDALLGLKL